MIYSTNRTFCFLLGLSLLLPISSFTLGAQEESSVQSESVDFSVLEEQDDLASLKDDLGVDLDYLDQEFEEKYLKKEEALKAQTQTATGSASASSATPSPSELQKSLQEKLKQAPELFDVGEEEKKILEISKKITKKIPEQEWNELATAAQKEKYTVVEGDYLWKISKNLFGTGFYYAKIWSLNPYITNPHLVQPGMVLVFDTGDASTLPQIQVGAFDEEESSAATSSMASGQSPSTASDEEAFRQLGDDAEPPWIQQKKELAKQGSFFQYATEKGYDDLMEASRPFRLKDYKIYDPPQPKIPVDNHDPNELDTGISADSKIQYDFKEGLALNTFITTNVLQDLGFIDSAPLPQGELSKGDTVYLNFLPDVQVQLGDRFSLYNPMGKVSYKKSDREGLKYEIVGELQITRRNGHLWEATITDSNSTIQRDYRITAHTPKIKKIFKTYNNRMIEGMVVSAFNEKKAMITFGDLVYLDRGRADGVELGNVFEVFSTRDYHNDRQITKEKTYKIAEITTIGLTDNFATALVTFCNDFIPIGAVAYTKSKEQAMAQDKLAHRNMTKDLQQLENRALENVDVDLQLGDINKDLLQKADQIQLSEDELEELEKQESEKSFLKSEERDLKELEKLEDQIDAAEKQLSESKLDEDRLIQNDNLNEVEKLTKTAPEYFEEGLNEMEQKQGRKYPNGTLQSKENPFGLAPTDVEDIDELLNSVENPPAPAQQQASLAPAIPPTTEGDAVPSSAESDPAAALQTESATEATADADVETAAESAAETAVESDVEANLEAETEAGTGPEATSATDEDTSSDEMAPDALPDSGPAEDSLNSSSESEALPTAPDAVPSAGAEGTESAQGPSAPEELPPTEPTQGPVPESAE